MRSSRVFGLALAAMVVAGPAFAQPGPPGHHRGPPDRHEWRGGEAHRHGPPPHWDRDRDRFIDRHRTVIREYYHSVYRPGHCPPGFVVRRHGCFAPTVKRRWVVGRPLPRGIVYYDLPPPLVARLGPPPAGYHYVRIGADVLLVGLATGIVVDSIVDLGGGW